MLLINTRPAHRAQALSAPLREFALEVLDLPLLELRPVAWNATLLRQYQQLLHAQIIVVVSPTAAEIGLAYLKQSGLSLAELAHVQWIAVGAATAEYLAQHQIHAHVPEVETSEGMLSLPILQQSTVQSVAFWRGEGGRQFMMQQLQQQGIQLLNFVLYTRHCPDKTAVMFQQQLPYLQHSKKKIYVCISSEASWLNWQALCQNAPELLKKCHYLALGERLYRLILTTQNLDGQAQVTAFARLAPDVIYRYLLEQKGLA
ncbi:uroporphyrinogen-III synthase [Acinetobacter sp. MD2(2019)]|uniref:uroporphyrinogen-III synthase n=1 Tax=Acinetobacter sp. MD2(2019) TaxID=2605273 RepID=UPI002D1F8529|nr:uroporphyrinogen-III synthase [Acinetobacter sp. MD2(2019)]MEB3754460.1 uroporphyrinogen-III synthase [Acinetobacter sp. MD2(2019)]